MKQQIVNFCLYLLSFILLWEWLRPLEYSTDSIYTVIFVIFIGISLFFTFMQLKWYISYPVKLCYIFFFIHQLFYNGSVFEIGWILEFIHDLRYNLNLITERYFGGMTPPFRTFLFFVLLWLLVYLLNYWIIQRKRILLFLILTITYVAVLDTFSPYDATYAIIRLAVVGFFLLGLLYFERMIFSEKIPFRSILYWKWIVPLLAMIVVSAAIGWLAPKAAPQWPDPLPYFSKYKQDGEGEHLSNSVVKKIGYGTNDEQLGGPFIPNDAPAFRAYVERQHYWRVETKDVYTGKGWMTSDRQFSIANGFIGPYLNLTSSQVQTEQLVSTVEIEREYPYQHIIYPLGLQEISSDADQYRIDHVTENIFPMFNESGERLSSYSLKYSYPLFEIEKLQAVHSNEGAPKELVERYTQLPASLPERVKNLAVEITKDKNNFYDKAKAVEQYFLKEPFVYETNDVAVPELDEDYVDQFLFETKKGYCDNFSTSMVVLLRSVGIPARWVKGYTPGQFVETTSEGLEVYEVTSNNAHSWVEVYFSGFGWVPFEPTIGFSNPQEFAHQSDENQQDSSAAEQEQSQPLEEESQEQIDTDDAKQPKEFPFSLSPAVIVSIGFILLIAACVLILFKTRNKWMTSWMTSFYKWNHDEKDFLKAYRLLLKSLERCGYKRENGQTLREYAKQIDQMFGTNSMSQLTYIYERALYRGDDPSKEWEQSKELWEDLIKKTTS
ncbi:DUF4129 domain-containing transglutaminase family protein [Aeribacillus sp. FSL k6-2211]|uniref:DUF4129 domain-containing transglutaminase family protein n=1 Tax=Aeribacillus sp. FSL k6-2211 TaxID=2954608 RepID=UPI0030D04596